jgi:GMP synthase-like glutamine amidotransferase
MTDPSPSPSLVGAPPARPLHVGLLLCDHVRDEVRDAAGGDLDVLYRRLLDLADPTIRMRVYAAVDGELPASPAEQDGWLLTGSRHSAYDELDWIRSLAGFVRGAVDDAVPVVGICFGHQLVAAALGGTVEPAGCWRIGPQEMDVEPSAWCGGGRVRIHGMHQDVVTALPPGGRRIATGTTGAYPAFVVDDVALGIQDHPEFDDTYESALVELRRPVVGDAAADEALAAMGDGLDSVTVARWIVDFLAAGALRTSRTAPP